MSISEFLLRPLEYIINLSFAEGVVPTEIKIAKVKPLFKAEDPHLFTNYRPISILPIVSKVFEKLVHKRLNRYLEYHNILYTNQFGFREKHSTELALISLNNFITNSFEKKDFALSIFLDFSKAFDTVNFDILIRKLRHYGVRGVVFKCFESYLSTRQQHVIFNNTSSENRLITTRVPQVFFLIYINDLSSVTSISTLNLFADDSSLLLQGNSPTDLIVTANNELDKVVKWLNSNRLSLNIKKSKYILFSRKGIVPVCNDKLYLNNDNVELERVTQIKYLGFIIDEKLSWKAHINYISLKISKNIAVLKKLVKVLNTDNLYNLYYSLIYPYLLNGNLVWGTALTCIIEPLVKLQKKTIRILTHSARREHTLPLLVNLNILPVKCLYIYNVLLFMFKVRNARLPETFVTIFTNYFNVSCRNTRQTCLYHIPSYRTTYLENTIIIQGPKLANKYKFLYENHCSIETIIFSYYTCLHITSLKCMFGFFLPIYASTEYIYC